MRIIVIILATLFLLSCLGCAAQKQYTLDDVDKLTSRLDSITQAKLKRDVEIFLAEEDKAYLLLENPYYLKFIKGYSNSISAKLFLNYKDASSSHYNRRLLGLLNIPQFMKDSLINYKYTELEVKAGVGHKESCQKIIQLYKEFISRDIATIDELNMHYYDKKLDVGLLSYIGSEESIRVFIEGMQSIDIYEDTNSPGSPKNKISILTNLLSSYCSLLGEPPLTSGFYFNQFLYVESERDFAEEHKRYLKQLEEFFNKKYNLNIKLNAPFFILGQEYVIEH